MNILANILGVIGIVFLVVSVQCNKKSSILIFQIFANIFYGLQYLTLGAFSAGVMSIVSLLRCLIFYSYDRKGKLVPLWLFLILALSIIFPIFFTYDGILSLFPIVATLVYSYATWQKNLSLFRKLVLSVSILWIIYNFCVGAYISVIGSVFEFVSSLLAIYRLDIKGRGKSESV